jgi:short-subunit dehydrogenase
MTTPGNADYSASKFALNGYLDALRQELNAESSPIALTNIYPYSINTGMF